MEQTVAVATYGKHGRNVKTTKEGGAIEPIALLPYFSMYSHDTFLSVVNFLSGPKRPRYFWNLGMAGPGSLWRDWGLGGAAVGLAVVELVLLATLRLALSN